MAKTVSEAIKYRRSVRKYQEIEIDDQKVMNCIKNATLAPNSSNMQLWEFYHITDKKILQKLSKACFDQNAAKTANQLVVFVTRKDLWKSRAKSNIDFLNNSFKENPKGNTEKRKKSVYKTKTRAKTSHVKWFSWPSKGWC